MTSYAVFLRWGDMTSPIILHRPADSPLDAMIEAVEWTALWRRCVPDMAGVQQGTVMTVQMPLMRPQDVLHAWIVPTGTDAYVDLVDELRGDVPEVAA
ncbi:MAG: hypothetical protein GVY18_04560 [Bacteroidetes bacterium]|jgi:hypothetical protein|nr:hypothetical protein [Bacteroidota bacterium]